ncbi:AmmeMemoRadiSam system radical SAM enzyme [Chloroflexi bacterium TSY]|nr:AmmeMemoRadiSam system radical SAM enzyme [Chloroflexi bacterium TSY]
MLREAILSRPLKKEYVQCTACEHWCAVAPSEAGKCGVRRNIDGTLQLVVYGKAIAAHIDPVEKKPLNHFLPQSPIFSIGTVGCNLFCQWCQNWDISQYSDFDPEIDYIGQSLSPTDVVEQCKAQHIPLVAFTYNEPTVFFEYAYDTAKLAHDEQIRTVFVSSGFETEQALNVLEPYLDAINVDLKAFRDKTYRTYCGVRLAPIKRNIERLIRETNIWTEVTTLLIPGLNDSDEELTEIAEFLAALNPNVPWHVTAFIPHYRMRNRPPTPADTLYRAWQIGKSAGVHYVYTGNIVDDPVLDGCSDTVCPACGQILVRRKGYHVQQFWPTPGACHVCGKEIAGVWH